jgi:hypothetical protein
VGRHPKPSNEYDALAKAAKAQLRRGEALGKSLDLRMKLKREASEEWVPDEDFRRDFQSITTTIQHCGAALIRALEGNKKNLGSLTEAQLQAQLEAELVGSATALTDEQWARMAEARAKAQR